MKNSKIAVALAVAALTLIAGCGKQTTPTPSANVPEVSQTPAIESPDMSPLVSPKVSSMPSPMTSPAASESAGMSSPEA